MLKVKYKLLDMKVAIIQISDIHLSGARDFIVSRLKLVAKSAKAITDSCDKIIVAVAGDIANKGKKEEYDAAYSFFKQLEKELVQNNDNVTGVEYVLAPGNHDCSLSEDEPVRDALIASVLKNTEQVSDEISTILLQPQDNYWNFYKELTGREAKNRISHEVRFNIDEDHAITFLCYNTSLCTKIHESVGALVVPEDKFINPTVGGQNNIVISLFHHNTGWLSPATSNKKLFEKHIFDTSNIVMCGHEHDKKELLESSLQGDEQIVYIEGAAFQSGKTSEYYIHVIDTDTYECEKHTLKYHASNQPELCLYKDSVESFEIRNRIRGLKLRKEFEERLLKLPIKITHPFVGDLNLSDCYVFPDLEPELDKTNQYGVYLDSEELVNPKNHDYRIYILEGASHCGKTSLLKMYYLRMLQKGVYPMLLKGNDIQESKHLDTLLEKTYKQQYESKTFSFDFYKQLEQDKKVLLIDNINRSPLNREGIQALYDSALTKFETIIVTTDERIKMSQIQPLAEEDYRQYKILSLGSIKRNLLIEKWQRLGTNYETIDECTLEHEVKEIFDTVSSILGEQYLSPYPFYLLSLLQNLNQAAKSQEVHQTYYAYCYKSLLISSLDSIKIEPEKQKQLLTFLANIAYVLYDRDELQHSFTEAEFENTFWEYKKKYVFLYSSPESCKKDLIDASILNEEDGRILFSSKYIYYYLAAEKLAEKLKDEDVKKKVETMCLSLYNEEYANILIFLVYHTKDYSLINSLISVGTLPFESLKPITLSKGDNLYSDVSGIIEDVKQKVMIQDVDPKKKRQESLQKAELAERKAEKEEANRDVVKDLQEIEKDPTLMELLTAMRSIRIMGQIVKNESSSLEKEKITELVVQTYNIGFRVISSFATMIQEESDDMVKSIVDEAKSKGRTVDYYSLRDKVGKMVGYFVYKFCLYNFSNLTHSVGTKNLDEIYDSVADQIGTPAARLVSFTIKSYYGKTLNISELRDLYREFDGNPVAQQVLRARALHYVYHNTVERSEKQKIGDICELRLVDKADPNKGKR